MRKTLLTERSVELYASGVQPRHEAQRNPFFKGGYAFFEKLSPARWGGTFEPCLFYLLITLPSTRRGSSGEMTISSYLGFREWRAKASPRTASCFK